LNYQHSKFALDTIDSQETLDGGIIIMVTGVEVLLLH
jgi:hypothetical protein